MCRELKIAGATVFLGLEGYGETAEMHRAHLVRSDRPATLPATSVATDSSGLASVTATANATSR